NLREKVPQRPKPFGFKLAFLVGGLAVLAGTAVRLSALAFPILKPYAWPLVEAGAWVYDLFGLAAPWTEPAQAKGVELVWLSLAESVVEFSLLVCLVRFGNLGWWALDRWLLGPFVLRPTDWLLDRMAVGYRWLLTVSLRYWGVVLVGSVLLIALAGAFLYFDIL